MKRLKDHEHYKHNEDGLVANLSKNEEFRIRVKRNRHSLINA